MVKPVGFVENEMAQVVAALREAVPVHVVRCGLVGACISKCSPYLCHTIQGNHHCVLKDVFAIASQKTA